MPQVPDGRGRTGHEASVSAEGLGKAAGAERNAIRNALRHRPTSTVLPDHPEGVGFIYHQEAIVALADVHIGRKIGNRTFHAVPGIDAHHSGTVPQDAPLQRRRVVVADHSGLSLRERSSVPKRSVRPLVQVDRHARRRDGFDQPHISGPAASGKYDILAAHGIGDGHLQALVVALGIAA